MLDVKVEHVSFSYVDEHPVLIDVSVTFTPGATAVIGQNGAGKTTLMKLLNGLLKPQSGTVTVGDTRTTSVETADISRHVGLVFQNPDAQIFKHNVRDEVEFGPRNIGRNERDIPELARSALAAVGLEDRMEDNPYDLSYTDRKKVCLASILAMDTEVVVLDEPTISQDADGLALMGRIVRDLADRGKTVIGIVHDMNFAAEYFDELLVMAGGRVLRKGSVREVFQDTDVLQSAHVEAPAMGKLSRAIGMDDFSLTTGEFVESYRKTRT